MKRPQSAKLTKPAYWVLPSSDDHPAEEELKIHHFKKHKNILKPNLAANSSDFSRLLPMKIPQDKQRLYSQTLQLKNNLNEILEQNIKLKTRVAILDKEKDKFSKAENSHQHPNDSYGKLNSYLNKKHQGQSKIIINLKKIVRQSKEESEKYRSELEKLKKVLKYTKLNQLEIEKQLMLVQNKRMSQLIQGLKEELGNQEREENQIIDLKNYLQQEIQQNKELNEDLQKYSMVVEELEDKLKNQNEKYLAKERKLLRDAAVEKRKAMEATKAYEALKNQLKIQREKKNEQNLKKSVMKKVITRPTSSHPETNKRYTQKNGRKYEIDEAISENQRLKKELTDAKQKLEQSQSQLHKRSQTEKQSFGKKNDESRFSKKSELEEIDFILTKNEEFQQFASKKSNQEYEQKFEDPQSQEPICKDDLVISGKKKKIVKQQRSKGEMNKKEGMELSPILRDMRQILTCRMKYNRYTFEELKGDIEVSPLHCFSHKDLANMLAGEPFYLSQKYQQQFLKMAFRKDQIKPKQELTSNVLLANLRKVIADFPLIQEDQWEEIMYKIAEVVTTHQHQLRKAFHQVNNGNKGQNTATKQNIINILKQFTPMTEKEEDIVICELSITSEDLQHLNYNFLLQRFLLEEYSEDLDKNVIKEEPLEEDSKSIKRQKSSSKKKSTGKEKNLEVEKQLSMGGHQDIHSDDLISDDAEI